MPELPEVETIARGVHARVRGDRITEAWFSRHKEPFKTAASTQGKGLAGRTILSVHRTGKHIVCDLGNAGNDEPSAQWIVHLGMTGRPVSYTHLDVYKRQGLGPTAIGTVISVTKAYVTRVGEGPFPTEVGGDLGDHLQLRGNEFGAVTGRRRRCGWLDLPLLRYSNRVNGTEWLVVTKLDVLDELAEIPICTGYRIDGKLIDEVPADVAGLQKIEPVYTSMKGWRQKKMCIRDRF